MNAEYIAKVQRFGRYLLLAVPFTLWFMMIFIYLYDRGGEYVDSKWFLLAYLAFWAFGLDFLYKNMQKADDLLLRVDGYLLGLAAVFTYSIYSYIGEFYKMPFLFSASLSLTYYLSGYLKILQAKEKALKDRMHELMDQVKLQNGA